MIHLIQASGKIHSNYYHNGHLHHRTPEGGARASHLGPPQQLLQLLLRQQAVVLDKSGHFGRTLRLEVHGPVDLHVAMQSGQEGCLPLFSERGRVVRG